MNNSKISPSQMQLLMVMYIFGFAVVTLPQNLAAANGKHGWVSLLLTSFLACLSVIAISFVAQKSGKHRFPEFMNSIVGKPLGKLICLLFTARLLLLAATRLNVFGITMNEFMLPYTPKWLVLLIFILTCIYAAMKKFETQARLAEILIVFMAIPVIYIILMSLRSAELTNFLPLYNIEIEPTVNAAFSSFSAFSGIELLFLIIPYVCLKKGTNITRRAFFTTLTIGLLVTISFASVIAVFGETTTVINSFQFLRMMDAAQIPGLFFTRQGALIMCFWIISAFAAISAEIFFASLLLKQVINLGKRRWYIFFCAAVAFGLVLAQNHNTVNSALQLINGYAGFTFMLALPLVLFLLYPLWREKANENS